MAAGLLLSTPSTTRLDYRRDPNTGDHYRLLVELALGYMFDEGALTTSLIGLGSPVPSPLFQWEDGRPFTSAGQDLARAQNLIDLGAQQTGVREVVVFTQTADPSSGDTAGFAALQIASLKNLIITIV